MIEGVGSAIPTTTVDNTLGQLGSDAFLELLVAQLRYQNPLAPTDGAAMLQQTAMFTQVETLQSIAAINQQLMGFQQVTMGLGLVGKEVDAVDADGLAVTGQVTSMRFTADGPFLRLADGAEIPMENVISVRPASGDLVASAPPPTYPPVSEPPPTDPPVSEPPPSEPPVSEPPPTNPPVSVLPPSEPPVSEPVPSDPAPSLD